MKKAIQVSTVAFYAHMYDYFKVYSLCFFFQVNSDTLKDNNPADTEAHAVHIFWPGIEEEQSKKQVYNLT